MSGIYRIEEIEVDPQQRCIRRNREPLHARARSFDLLLYLIEHRDRLVPKEELFETLWPDTAVTDNSLVQCVNDVRKVLGDDARNPRFIKTVPKSGYQFIGPIEEDAAEIQEDPAEGVIASVPRSGTWLWFGAGAVCVLLLALLLGSRFSLSGRQAVAVLPFVNQSSTADLDWLREGLPGMLTTNLSRWSRLSVLSRPQVHDWSARGTLKDHAAILVEGTFARLGEKLHVAIQIEDARTGKLLDAENLVTDRPEQVVSQVDLLATRIASRLGAGARPEDQPSLGFSKLMTSNLEAYRDYSLGVEAAQALRVVQAISYFEKAAALDPNFIMAEARIGYVYAVPSEQPEVARPYLERAYRHADRLSEKDRLDIAAWYATANLDFEGAIRTYRQINTRFPEDVEAYTRLAELQIGEQRYDEAVATLQKALMVDPDDAEVHNSLHHAYEFSARLASSLMEAERYVALAPSNPNAFDSLGLANQAMGHYDQAEANFRQALALDPNFEIPVIHLGNVYFQAGRYHEAITQYEAYFKIATTDRQRSRACDNLAGVYLRLGQLEEARLWASKPETQHTGPRHYNFALLARDRDLATFDNLMQRTTAISINRGRRGNYRDILVVRAQRAILAGKTAEGIAALREALRRPPPYFEMDWLEDCLADAYFDLGRFDDAIAEYNRALALYPAMGLMRFHLAAAYDRKGDQVHAREQYRRFLDTWKNADADIPEVIAARKQLAGA